MQWRSKEDLLPHSGIRQAPNPEMRTQETAHHSATLVPTHRQPIEHDLRRNESEGKTQYFHPTTLLPDASSCSQKAHCPPVLLIPELLHKGATAEAASAQVHPNVAAVKQRRAHLLLPDLQGECQCGLSAIPPRHGWEKHLWQEPLASNWSASNDQCQQPSPTRQCQRKRRSAVPSLPNLAIDQQIQHQLYRQLQQNGGDLLWVPGPAESVENRSLWHESVPSFLSAAQVSRSCQETHEWRQRSHLLLCLVCSANSLIGIYSKSDLGPVLSILRAFRGQSQGRGAQAWC